MDKEIEITQPPKGPPCRTICFGLFGRRETRESIRAREDYAVYIKAYMEGLSAGRMQGRQFAKNNGGK